MHASSVILIALVTSVLTSFGTVFVMDRQGMLPPRVQPIPETMVPDLVGASESDARANAGVAHLGLIIESRQPSPDAKPGTVLSQSPRPGQRVPRAYPVSVVLAAVMPRVPGVLGLGEAQAKARLEQVGYRAEVAKIASATVAKDLVVEQTPKADDPLAKGGKVVLQVSSGPGEVEIPKLLGVAVAKAQADLEKLALKPVVRWVAMAETATYVVLSQKPAAGEKVAPGTEVQIVACR